MIFKSAVLLAATPGTIGHFVAVPRATVFGELFKRYLVHVTVRVFIRDSRAGALCGWLCRWLCNRILLQERSQSGEE